MARLLQLRSINMDYISTLIVISIIFATQYFTYKLGYNRGYRAAVNSIFKKQYVRTFFDK